MGLCYAAPASLGEAMPVYLFTMGCPLRQLYGLRFPYLYGWARGADYATDQNAAGGLSAEAPPDPKDLGIRQWVNAFRSGDYVGRHLWRSDAGGYGWDPITDSSDENWDPPAGRPEKISSDKDGSRIEFSIGPGAHTHYWDHTAKMIAEVLDRLIQTV